jgi:hypothetical protein
MGKDIPVFAVIGHPNEGKSSVVSTLAEDDSVRISPTPGETRQCMAYPVVVDGEEIIRFVDTPGFQEPRRTLEWMRAYTGPSLQITADFIASHSEDPDFRDECELLTPLARGAGIIYVADGSRPMRYVDAMEMEILRLTTLPRMAVINAREKNRPEFADAWIIECRKHFNTIVIFDAQQADYADRMDLLECLKSIDPDRRPALARVITAFETDWRQRILDTADIISDLVQAAASHRVEKTASCKAQASVITTSLKKQFEDDILRMEKTAHKQIRRRFKHHVFSEELPPHPILSENLFSKKSWKVLGLNNWHLAVAGGTGGAAIGAKVDLAAAGQSLGLFTAIGGVLGAGAGVLGIKPAAKATIKGLPLGWMTVRVGPSQDDQMLYVLLDRCLIYFRQVSRRAHSRRDALPSIKDLPSDARSALSAGLEPSARELFSQFFRAARKNDALDIDAFKPAVSETIAGMLRRLSSRKTRY